MSRCRSWAFRLAAVLLGLSPLWFCEAALRLAGWGRASEVDDPYVGFVATHPLFELNRARGRREIPKSRQALFYPESFAAEKGKREFRIFCLGGSTVQGRPYGKETSFTSWLELSLQAADPSRRWEVVNCGGVSYASYRLLPLLRELLDYQPDAFIIYAGHNEFLEDRSYREVKQTPRAVAVPHALMSRCRTYNLLRTSWLEATGRGAASVRLPADADPLLDYRDGLAAYHRDDRQRAATIEHFRFSLRRMIQLARDAGVPVLLCNPVANIKDTPPFKVAPSESLTVEQAGEFRRLYAAAMSAARDDASRRIRLLERALAIDDRHAAAHYQLGKCYLAAARPARARQALLRAKDEDICPLRILESMHGVVRAVARQSGTPLVDVRQAFEQVSPGGLPGNEWLVDHVHPTIAGHQLIADQLLQELIRQGWATPRGDWQARREARFDEQLARLPPEYYAAADERLAGLRRWTQGRAFQASASPGFLQRQQ